MTPASPRGISRTELAIFCRQFSAILSAGVDAFQGIAVLRKQTDNPQLVAVLDSIAQDLSLGRSLAHAFARFPHYFSPLFISLVRQGEREGILGEIMLKLAEHLEREARVFSLAADTPPASLNWEVFVEQLRPLVLGAALVISTVLLMVAGLWYVTLTGWLPRAYLGPNIVLLIGVMVLALTMVVARYRPPRLVRCNFCGRPESVAGTLIPGEGVWICADCVQRSVQILREHQAALADQPVEVNSPRSDAEMATSDTMPQQETLWRPRGQVIYLSDTAPSEDERIKILPKPDEGA